MSELPRTESGAIDRDRLSKVVGQFDASARQPAAPRTELERQIARLWQEVFQVPRVSIYDNFFEMGGHSLLAAQLMARLAAALAVDLPLSSLFSDPTVAGLARAVESYRRDGSTADLKLDMRAEAELPSSIELGSLASEWPARPAQYLPERRDRLPGRVPVARSSGTNRRRHRLPRPGPIGGRGAKADPGQPGQILAVAG